MVHILPLINTPGFTPEFDKENELYIENQNGLLVQYIAAGHGVYKRYRWWYSNGQIGVDAHHKNGERHGQRRVCNGNGNLIADEVWENGKLVKG